MKGKSKKRCIVFALIACMSIGVVASAASVTKTTYISATYGYLRGTVGGNKLSDEKCMYSYALTDNAVPRIRSKLTVHYSSSGTQIGSGENTDWIYSSSSAYTSDYEMHHFTNQVTGRNDGFLNTALTAYGTADAITSDPYVVYTTLSNF